MENKTKIILSVIAVVVFFMIIGFTGNDTKTQPINTEKQVVVETVAYEKLREWNPGGDSLSKGYDILISPKDLSKENVINLSKKLSKTGNYVIVRVYQDVEAQRSAESGGDFNDIERKGYISYYVKSPNGTSEVRWFQEIGLLSDLYGTKTKI